GHARVRRPGGRVGGVPAVAVHVRAVRDGARAVLQGRGRAGRGVGGGSHGRGGVAGRGTAAAPGPRLTRASDLKRPPEAARARGGGGVTAAVPPPALGIAAGTRYGLSPGADSSSRQEVRWVSLFRVQ